MIEIDGLLYDPDTGIFTMSRSSGRRKAGDVAGYVKADGYRLISYRGRYHYAHRLAWLAVHGEMPNGELDHINGIRDDNRIENLRNATRSQNMMNVQKGKGWHWHKRKGCWQAQIRANGKRVFLGLFKTEDEARQASNRARLDMHGEYAFIERPTPPKQEALL